MPEIKQQITTGNLKSSTLLKKVNNRDFDDAAAAAGGVPVGSTYMVTGGTIAWRQT